MEIIPTLDKLEDGRLGLSVDAKDTTVDQLFSHSRVAKRFSHRALSKHSPTDPIEDGTPDAAATAPC